MKVMIFLKTLLDRFSPVRTAIIKNRNNTWSVAILKNGTKRIGPQFEDIDDAATFMEVVQDGGRIEARFSEENQRPNRRAVA